jgi:hypothetical protein
VNDAPSGWSTPAGDFGHHRVYRYQYDELGRRTQVLGPPHDAAGPGQTIRSARWFVRVENGPGTTDEYRIAKGYATGSPGSFSYTMVGLATIWRMGKAWWVTQERITSERSSGSGRLAASDSFNRPEWVAWKANTFADDGTWTAK